jgi:hypothetical protein
MALSIFALGAPIGAWLGANAAGAIAQDHGWRAAFYALGIPGVLLGVLVFLTVREPKRGRLDAIDRRRQALVADLAPVLWRQRAAFHVIMASGVCCLWGWGLVWWTPTFLLRRLRAQRRPGRRRHRQHPPGGRHHRHGGRRVVHGPPVHARSAPHSLGARVGHRTVDDSVVHRLLDAARSRGEADVLALHPRHLFLSSGRAWPWC